MDRNRRRAVGSVAGRCDQSSCARSGATRNEIPDAARTAPATMAALFTTPCLLPYFGTPRGWLFLDLQLIALVEAPAVEGAGLGLEDARCPEGRTGHPYRLQAHHAAHDHLAIAECHVECEAHADAVHTEARRRQQQ